tara:strand:- start:16 stop:216 length:201 start_codon:yes stop_codon:yes gene_type:complete
MSEPPKKSNWHYVLCRAVPDLIDGDNRDTALILLHDAANKLEEADALEDYPTHFDEAADNPNPGDQ